MASRWVAPGACPHRWGPIAAGDGTKRIVDAMVELQSEGADNVVVTCGEKGMLAMLGGRLVRSDGPHVATVEARGAGDSLTAGLAAGMTMGRDLEASLRLGVSAATLNVTRHGLASGTREEIERLVGHIDLQRMEH